MFERFPAGESIFLDANVFLYHVLESRPSCAVLFRRARVRELHAVTSPIVLSEVIHRLLLAETVERFSLASSKDALNLLRRHPEHVANLTVAARFTAQLSKLGVRVLPVRRQEILRAVELGQRHHLLTNDALIVASMRTHHLTHLATNDRDFSRVPDLTIWRP